MLKREKLLLGAILTIATTLFVFNSSAASTTPNVPHLSKVMTIPSVTTTESSTTTQTTRPPAPKQRPRIQRPASSHGSSGSAPLACINRHEGSPAYGQHDGGKYSGRYQFDLSTWKSNANAAGYPQDATSPSWMASPAVQDAVATFLYHARGLGPWPPSQGKC